MVSIPNIYKGKYVKYYILVPLLLMALGAYFSTKVILGPSLSGGVQITMLTNQTIAPSLLASEISSKLGVFNPQIVESSGSISVTLPLNRSIGSGEGYLLSFYAYNSNYTAALYNMTAFENAYKSNPSNATLSSQIQISKDEMNKSLAGMDSSLSAELNTLKPFIGSQTFNSTDVAGMTTLANSAYNASLTRYKNSVVSAITGIVPAKSYQFEEVSATLGSFFLSQLKTVIITAFILVSLVIFIVIFRSPIPAFAVVFGAVNDIIVSIGAMAVFKIPLDIASIGGLLMLIGYSIDTDVLTSVRILKRHEGTAEDRAYSAMRTGLTMTTTAIVSFAVLFIVSLVVYVPTYYEISGIVLFGLIADIFTTWLGNASMVLLYKKRKEKI